MAVELMQVYQIENVTSKDKDIVNRWHGVCVGKRCLVFYLKQYNSMDLRVEDLKCEGEWTRFVTSRVLEINESADSILVETVNSVYQLRRLGDDRISRYDVLRP